MALLGFLLRIALVSPAFLPLSAALSQEYNTPRELGYADMADLVLGSPVIADAIVTKAIKVDRERTPDLPAEVRRVYVEAELGALIRGRGGLPEAIRYVVDLPLDARGKLPKIEDRRFLLFAAQGGLRPGEIQLTAPDAQLLWTPERDRLVRAIAAEAVSRAAPPEITGILSAFHARGTILGEGETQIFLAAADRRAVSLSVLSRPGQDRRWGVSLGEIVDEAAAAPAPETLLWYRLACGLPGELPAAAIQSSNPADIDKARSDYRYVRESLGPCGRRRAAPGR